MEFGEMGRPRLFDEPLTPAERARRYRAKRKADDVLPMAYRPLLAVTEAALTVTKPPPQFDPQALIA